MGLPTVGASTKMAGVVIPPATGADLSSRVIADAGRLCISDLVELRGCAQRPSRPLRAACGGGLWPVLTAAVRSAVSVQQAGTEKRHAPNRETFGIPNTG
jgi:hypothetical protein